jgi:RNA polymerase sigma factor (sigma-70 family)
MITEQEAQDLVSTYRTLKEKANSSQLSKDIITLRQHEALMLDKLKYVVDMRTYKYKRFSNYEDLRQEVHEALLKAISNFDPKKGSFFWWFQHYAGTRVARNASTHSAIRYPIRVSKNTPPMKSSIYNFDYSNNTKNSTMNEIFSKLTDNFTPDKSVEYNEVFALIKSTFDTFSEEEQDIISLAFGFTNKGNKSLSPARIAQKMGLKMKYVSDILDNALLKIKETLDLDENDE